MLDRRHDAPLDFCLLQGKRQRFAGPAGQDHFTRPAQRRCDPRPRILQRGARGAAGAMRAGRVGPDRKSARHRLGRLRQQGRGRGMIQIGNRVGQDGSCLKDCFREAEFYIAIGSIPARLLYGPLTARSQIALRCRNPFRQEQ
jgi:hypothetical protein